jgi:hypothetical protein
VRVVSQVSLDSKKSLEGFGAIKWMKEHLVKNYSFIWGVNLEEDFNNYNGAEE